MKNLSRLFSVCCAFLLVVGCANQKDTAPAGLLNTKCVISGEAIPADGPTVDYMGGKVGFCCDQCIPKWNAMNDAGKKAALDAKK